MTAFVVVTALAAAPAVRAQATSPPLTIDPATAGQGTSLTISLDSGALISGGRRATATVVSLPRGMHFDSRARERTCSTVQAARGGCPKASKIGFGRSVATVRGFLSPGGETEVSWSVDAYLGRAERRSDLASIVLRAKLLGTDRVDQLLAPLLGHGVSPLAVSIARVLPLRSSPYAFEIRFPSLPGEVGVPASMTETPEVFSLVLSAVRRVRVDFVHHIRVETADGYRTERIPDHRLIGYDLLRAPSDCSGPWKAELRTSSPSGSRRVAQHLLCAKGV